MQKTSQSSIEYRLTLVSSWAWTFFHCNLCGYSGDHDLTIAFLGTQASIRSLNFPKVEDWTAWHFNGQAAGLSHLTPFFFPTLTYDVYEGFRSPAEYTNVCQIKIVLQSNRLESVLTGASLAFFFFNSRVQVYDNIRQQYVDSSRTFMC